MTRRRFHAPSNAHDLEAQIITLPPEETRHLRDVLRLKEGDEVYVFNGAGREFRCTVAGTSRHSATLQIEAEVQPAKPESHLQLQLGVALLKGEKFDLVVQKATELGANSILPLITRYADIHLRDEADARKRVTRWQRIALEAAKQSGRAVVPEIQNPLALDSFLTGTNEADLCLMFSERGGDALTSFAATASQRVTALVGSEGGWSDEEIASARAAGLKIVTLGGRTLRAETAAIAVATLLQHLFGDLK